MKNNQLKTIRIIRLIVVSLFFCVAFSSFFYSRLNSPIFGSEREIVPSPTPPKSKKAKTPVKKDVQPSKYANFQHPTHINLKLACDSCHKVPTANWDKVRPKETAFQDVTDFPQHQSCINCHRQQFFTGRPPAICANCHTNPSPKDSSRYPFPNPREVYDTTAKGKTATSEFQVYFPHDKHIEIVSQNENPFETKQNGVSFVRVSMKRAGEESCKVCHQTYQAQDKSDDEYLTPPPKDLGDNFWVKKGMFKTSPISHATCFTCHNADTGMTPAPTDCGACHKPIQKLPVADFDFALAQKMNVSDRISLDAWKRRDAGKFRHEFSSHADMDCATCHNAAAMNTLDFKTKKVAVSSCAPCHITATADDGGILNAEVDAKKKDAKFDCVKCHISFGKLPVPESHTKAIEAQK